jgi:mutator protein MutT
MQRLEVAAAVLVHEGKVLLARRDGGAQNGLWEFPGGKLEDGETWAQAVEREILEELDLRVAAIRRLCVIEHDYPEKRIRLHFVFCRCAEIPEKILATGQAGWYAPKEFSGVHLCPPDRLAASTLPWPELFSE